MQSAEAMSYLHKRKLAYEVIEAYKLGYDPADKTVLFPVRDAEGRIAFYKGRSLVGKHFYNAKEIDKTSLVFGLYELCNGFTKQATANSTVWITESEIDALSLISQGEYAVAIMGSHISEEQCRELERSPFRKFILATDNDEAGRKGATQIKQMLIPKGFRFTNLKWRTDIKDINDLIKAHGDNWRKYLTGY
jgi:DNA primase